MAGSYKIRVSGGNPPATKSYALTVPREMADQVPDDLVFTPEWHPDGILFRAELSLESQAPAWARREPDGSNTQAGD